MKNALFVQANVAVNAKLTSKVPFLFGNFDVFKNNLVKKANFGVCPFQYPKVHLEAGAPPPKKIFWCFLRPCSSHYCGTVCIFSNYIFLVHVQIKLLIKYIALKYSNSRTSWLRRGCLCIPSYLLIIFFNIHYFERPTMPGARNKFSLSRPWPARPCNKQQINNEKQLDIVTAAFHTKCLPSSCALDVNWLIKFEVILIKVILR